MYINVSNIYIGIEGRLIIFDYKEYDQLVSITAIYAPNEDSPIFFTDILKKLRTRSEHKIVIGDFNLTLDPDLDRKNTYCNNNRAKYEVEQMMDEFSLKDIWRIQNGDKREYSWIRIAETVKASRIDLALVSGGLDQKTKAVTYVHSIKTDHRAIYIVVDLSYTERGNGYWKMNTTLLRNKKFLQKMNQELNLTTQLITGKEPCNAWEIIKKRIKKCTIEFAKNSFSESKLVIAQLSEKVNEYEANFPLTKEDQERWQVTKTELEEKLLERAQGIMFRSKVKWYEEGERNTKYFYSLEKIKYNAKTCYKVINSNQEEITDTRHILTEQRNFYSQLYSRDEHVNFNLENNTNIRVPNNIKNQQEEQLTINDLESAIKTMKNNKTPGNDGIPIDFYKVFWNQLKDHYYKMVMEVYTNKILHQTAREGILNLIPKPNKDSRYIKNLRPITLLNTDYKIIEKAIANKMIPALDHIIHTHQRGFMKNRRISVNIRKMLDIMHQVEKEDLEAVILSLDFVKCFDKCSFSILHGSLDFFNFGNIIKDWTKILYRDFTVKIQNNGHMSDQIPIHKGVHQGGCCSSVYFLVIAEILAIAIRDNKQIEGITIEDIRNILNQFADDMDVFSLANQKSIQAIMDELDRFHYQSGFTVSYEKTTLYRIGSLRHSDAQMYNMSQYAWSNKDINILGVTIAHEEIVQKNYIPLIEKTKQTLNAWYNRGLSLIGKIQVINTLIASQFVYKMMVLPSIPVHIVKTVENIMRDFIWNNKKSKIAFKVLQNPKTQGGLNLVDLKKKDIALKATWPQIISKEKEYAQIVYKTMRCSTLQQNIWKCRIAPQDVKLLRIKNNFWEDVLRSWNEYNFYHNQRAENQIIWYNSNIKIGKKVNILERLLPKRITICTPDL